MCVCGSVLSGFVGDAGCPDKPNSLDAGSVRTLGDQPVGVGGGGACLG